MTTFISVSCIYITPRHLRHFSWMFFCFCLGMTWADVRFQLFSEAQISQKMLNHPIDMLAEIITLPEHTSHGQRFIVLTKTLDGHALHRKILLSTYELNSNFQVGDLRQWHVKLTAPHGLHNPEEFDYEGWLFYQGIEAKGYTLAHTTTQLISHYQNFFWDAWRARIQRCIMQSVKNHDEAAILSALAVGYRGEMDETLWTVFQNTGTNHLIAIAGLHIGFVAFFIYALSFLLWRISYPLLRFVPAQIIAGIIALLFSVFYSLLAGLTLPTERALTMFLLLVVGDLFHRKTTLCHKACIAIWIILLLDPGVLLSQSFWLSFLAITSIGYIFEGRHQSATKIKQWSKAQAGIFLGILPITLWFFQKISWVSLIANAIAIPWVGFCIVPLSFVASIISLINASLGEKLFFGCSLLLHPLWLYLKWLAFLHFAIWNHGFSNAWMFLASVIAVAIILMPRGLPGRWLSIIWILPFICARGLFPPSHEIWLTLLDVGQGLAVVVATSHHVLLFDAGPRFPEGFDAGSSVIFPYLLQLQHPSIDVAVISHGDNDHIGGIWSLLKLTNIKQIMTSVPQKFSAMKIKVQPCYQGESWQWDGITFEMLNPPLGQAYAGNNSSCVLKIGNGKQSILLTGDIEKKAENYLLLSEAQKLAATVLIVPHHGSATSSSLGFIQAIHPRYALFGVGYHNRYRFPASAVLKRYWSEHSCTLTTAKNGAIFVRLSDLGSVTLATMDQSHRFWQH